jgi:hypothetical protein
MYTPLSFIRRRGLGARLVPGERSAEARGALLRGSVSPLDGVLRASVPPGVCGLDKQDVIEFDIVLNHAYMAQGLEFVERYLHERCCGIGCVKRVYISRRSCPNLLDTPPHLTPVA